MKGGDQIRRQDDLIDRQTQGGPSQESDVTPPGSRGRHKRPESCNNKNWTPLAVKVKHLGQPQATLQTGDTDPRKKKGVWEGTRRSTEGAERPRPFGTPNTESGGGGKSFDLFEKKKQKKGKKNNDTLSTPSEPAKALGARYCQGGTIRPSG